MAKNITPQQNQSNQQNANKGTFGTNRQYDQNQGYFLPREKGIGSEVLRGEIKKGGAGLQIVSRNQTGYRPLSQTN